jgi:hypothetical protein
VNVLNKILHHLFENYHLLLDGLLVLLDSLHVILNDLSSLLHNFFQFCHDDVFDVISDKSSLRSAIVTDESMQDRTPAIITGTKEENQIWVREELRIERDRTKVE